MLQCMYSTTVVPHKCLESIHGSNECSLLDWIVMSPVELSAVRCILLKMGSNVHAKKNWCEMIATGLTPDFSVMVTPSIMV